MPLNRITLLPTRRKLRACWLPQETYRKNIRQVGLEFGVNRLILHIWHKSVYISWSKECV